MAENSESQVEAVESKISSRLNRLGNLQGLQLGTNEHYRQQDERQTSSRFMAVPVTVGMETTSITG